MVDIHLEETYGLHTILGLNESIKVKYDTANLGPVEHIQDRKVRSLGMRTYDTIMRSEFFEVEIDAHYLIIDTMKRARRAGAKLPYDTHITRVEHLDGKKFLDVCPAWMIENFGVTESDGVDDMLKKHNQKVEEIQKMFREQRPGIIYNGSYLHYIHKGFNLPEWKSKFTFHHK